MTDNPFNTPVSGQASWDDGLSLNFQVIERGYHWTERAGQAISSGQLVALNSGGFAFPYDPNSTSPCVGYCYTAAASGDSLTALAWGIVRSLGINSPAVPGKLMFSNASGFLSTTTLGPAVGVGLSGYGLLFQPSKSSGSSSVGVALVGLTDVVTTALGEGYGLRWSNVNSKFNTTFIGHRVQSVQVAAVQDSLHLFTMSLGGLFGWNRRVRLNGASTSNVAIKFFRDSGRTDLQYETASGGISAVTSFHDRAGWPIDTDSGTIYGSVQIFSLGVGSDTLNIICDWEV